MYLEAEALGAGGIKLKWRAGVFGSKNVFRRPLGSVDTPTLVASAVGGTEWTDLTAGPGQAFEYVVNATAASNWIYAGNAKGATHDRGTILLVIDQTVVDGNGASLQPSIDQFTADLIGEGYNVVTRTVSRKDIPRAYPPQGATAQEIVDLHADWRNAVIQTKGIIRDVWDDWGSGLKISSSLEEFRYPIPDVSLRIFIPMSSRHRIIGVLGRLTCSMRLSTRRTVSGLRTIMTQLRTLVFQKTTTTPAMENSIRISCLSV